MKTLIQALLVLSLVSVLACHSKGPRSQQSSGGNESAAPLRANGIDWKKIASSATQKNPNLTLWLRADGKVTLAPDGKTIVSWTDESSNRVEFTKPETDHDGPVLEKSGAEHHGAAVRFGGKDQVLVTGQVQGSRLVAQNEASLFVVEWESSMGSVADTIGWGGCGSNRLNAHYTAGNSLVFQMGNPGVSAIGTGAPADWSKGPHVVSVVVKAPEARMSIDGVDVLDSKQFKSTIDLDAKAPVTIAGICSNGLKGEISEVALYKKALSRPNELQIVKSLAEKYGIPLR